MRPAAVSADPPVAPTVPFAQALRFWLKLGFISFGGPSGQIAIMHAELVERQRWISEQRFLHALNYCMLLPGPEAQQLATYLGWLMHKTRGGLAAGLLFVLPSLLILIALSWVYLAFGHTPVVLGLFAGIKPAVTAIVIQAVVRIGGRTLRNRVLWAISASSFVAMVGLGLPFPLVIAAAALTGWLGARWRPQDFLPAVPTQPTQAPAPSALFNEHSARPDHTVFSWRRLRLVLLVSSLLWLLPMAALSLAWGWQHSLTQMAWFFTKAAFLTFGGAYAVLPYVYQGAVLHHGWLTPTQMMDGLALGETTPGPLIMVVAFVGFVGAYVQALFGPEAQFLAGALAAVLVSWFTFLPSFMFILAGGPLVESTHQRLSFTAPLTAITAAIVGVMAQLALFFAFHTLWPNGLAGGFHGPSALIALAAAWALLGLKRSVIEVIAWCALLGLGWQFLIG